MQVYLLYIYIYICVYFQKEHLVCETFNDDEDLQV